MASPTLLHLPPPPLLPSPPSSSTHNPSPRSLRPKPPTTTTSAIATQTSTISTLIRRNHLHSAATSLSLLLSTSSPNHITLLSLISALSSTTSTPLSLSLALSLHSLSLKLFPLHLPLHPSLLLNSALLQLYSKLRLPHLARQLFDTMPIKNSFTFNSIINCHMLSSQPRLALDVFHSMPLDNRDKITWTALIDGFIKNGLQEDALLHFRDMQLQGTSQGSEKVEPDYVMILALVSACTEIGALGQGMWVHRYAMSRGGNLCGEIRVVNSLIDMYSRCGRVDLAQQVFDGVENGSRTRVTWNSMIVGFAINGCCGEALEHFELMRGVGFEPDGVSFTGALTACSHGGLVDEGMRYYDLMKREYKKIPMRIEHYGCLVDLLGRAGRLEKAMSVVESMMPVMGPNEVVLSSLLAACRMHGNVGLAERLVGYLVELEPETESKFVMLSNIYAAVGRWDGAGEVRNAMKSLGIKKSPGYSAVEIDGALHEFVAGDRRHMESDEIYCVLKILCSEMKLLHCDGYETEVEAFKGRYADGEG